MKLLMIVFIFLGLFSCSNKKNTPSIPPKNNRSNTASPGFTYRIEFKDGTGWGYQVFDGKKLILNQDHIPAIQGNIGFSNKDDAQKTAVYIIEKLEKGIFPPTLSIDELDSLKVLPKKKLKDFD